MSYTHDWTIDASTDHVDARVLRTLAEHGFGEPTKIDVEVQATLIEAVETA